MKQQGVTMLKKWAGLPPLSKGLFVAVGAFLVPAWVVAAFPALAQKLPNWYLWVLAAIAWLCGEIASGIPFRWLKFEWVRGQPLKAKKSTARGWLVGLAVGFGLYGACVMVAPAFMERHEWLAWGPILIGIFAGRAATEEPRPAAALRNGLLGFGGLVLALGVLALLALGVYALYRLVTDYGIQGIIAILLGVIVVMLGVIISRSRDSSS